MIPIVSLLPIVDSQQKLVGLMPNMPVPQDQHATRLIDYLAQIDFFERLFPLNFFVPVHHIDTVMGALEYPPNIRNVVFCFPETLCQDKDVQTKLSTVQQGGVRVMVDQFNSKSSLIWPDTKSVAVNCEQILPSQVQAWIMNLSHGQHLAHHLHTVEGFLSAQEIGFSLFSGDFPFGLSRKTKADDPSARSRLLKLLSLLAHDADVRELEALFKQDSALSYMLFKLSSSAAFAQASRVTSFVQAINLIGRRQLQRWLQLLLYAQQGSQFGSALNPLMLRAAYRASMCEALCQQAGGDRDQQDAAFMAGMFSLLDLLFVAPLADILQALSLPDFVLQALLERQGELGAILKLVESADRSQLAEFERAFAACHFAPEAYYQCVLHAYDWVNKVSQEL